MASDSLNDRFASGRISASPLVKVCLAVLFLLGAVLAFTGYRGKAQAESAGFSSENSFAYVYELSRDTDRIWNGQILPALEGLTPEELDTACAACEALLSGEFGEASVTGSREYSFKALFSSYLFGGPKLSSSERKRITGPTGTDAQELRIELMRCIADEKRELPAAVRGIAGDLTGRERQAALMQSFFVSCGSASPDVTSHVNQLKKGVRGRDQQIRASTSTAAKASDGSQNPVSTSL